MKKIALSVLTTLGLIGFSHTSLAVGAVRYGTVTFKNSVTLPLMVVVDIYDAANSELQSFYPKSHHIYISYFSVPPSQAKQLVVYYAHNQMFLVPRNFKIVKAFRGVSGGHQYKFVATNGVGSLISYSDGFCFGCAVSSIARWVPGWKERHKKEVEGLPIDPLRPHTHLVRLRKHIIAFSYPITPTVSANGVVNYFYSTDKNTYPYFERTTLILPNYDKKLATTILNFDMTQ